MELDNYSVVVSRYPSFLLRHIIANLATPALLFTSAIDEGNVPVGVNFVGWRNKYQIGYHLPESDQYSGLFLTYLLENSLSTRVIGLLQKYNRYMLHPSGGIRICAG